MANRKRKIVLRCPVTEEERKLIEQKMAQLPTSQIGAYLRKMAIDGYIIYVDVKNIKQYIQELQAIGKNINQIARRVNSTTNIYKEDIEEIKKRLDETSSTEISKSKKQNGFKEAEDSVIKGGNIARIAKEQLERETGKKVVSDKNAREIRKLNFGEE